MGLATKQAAMGWRVRAYLYNKDYENTVEAAKELMELDKTLENSMFLDDYKSYSPTRMKITQNIVQPEVCS